MGRIPTSPVTQMLNAEGYTLVTAAELFGVSYTHMVNVARGRTRPSRRMVLRFREEFGLEVADMLENWVEKNAHPTCKHCHGE